MTMVERFLLWVDDRLGTRALRPSRAAQSVSRSLVVHARRDQRRTPSSCWSRPAHSSRSSSIPNAPKVVYNGPYALLDGATISAGLCVYMRV